MEKVWTVCQGSCKSGWPVGFVKHVRFCQGFWWMVWYSVNSGGGNDEGQVVVVD